MENKKIIILLIICLLILGCSKDAPKTADKTNETGKEYLEKFKMKEVVKGEKIWELEAIRADINNKTRMVNLQEPHIDFFEGKEKVSFFESDKGVINLDTKDMQSYGNVVMHSLKEDMILRTEEMSFDNKRKRFLSDSFIQLERENSITTGIGFEATPDLEEIEIKEDVNIEVKE